MLSLGSNLGDRLAHLRAGVAVLEPVAVSPVYETAPWGGVEQDDFLNVVVLCDYDADEAWRRAVRAEEQEGIVLGFPAPQSIGVEHRAEQYQTSGGQEDQLEKRAEAVDDHQAAEDGAALR